jgi:hypothetical protein
MNIYFRSLASVHSTLLMVATLFCVSSYAQTVAPSPSRETVKQTLLRQPLYFEPAADGAMTRRSPTGTMRLDAGGKAQFAAPGKAAISMGLDGANTAAKPTGEEALPGRSNYLLGNNPARWRTGVGQFSRIRVPAVYQGIDLIYYGNGDQLEHDFIVSPGVDPNQIRMRFSDAASQVISKHGDLQLKTHGGSSISLEKPVAYQIGQDGSHVPVAANYVKNDEASFGFKLGNYDRTRSLIIDPVITYSTYFGGSGFDEIKDIKTDATGDIYLLLETNSVDLPATKQIAGACASGCGPGNPSNSAVLIRNNDMYVAKLDSTGKTLLFSTYIGGSSDDIAGSFALGSDGAIYIAGETVSSDFPFVNQYSSLPLMDTLGNVDYSTTLTKLSADGSKILYSSLIGGGLVQQYGNCCRNGQEGSAQPGSVAVGADGIAYLIGFAATDNEVYGVGTFIDQKGVGTTTQGAGSFLAKFDTTKAGNDSLIFALPYGQPNEEGIQFKSIALDSKGDVWAIGSSPSRNAKITLTPDALQPVCGTGDPNNCDNFYLVEMDPNGAIIYATYFGGTTNSGGGPGEDVPYNIFLDSSDNIYVTGGANSIDFPLKNAAYTMPFDSAAFLTKFAPGGKSVLYSTYAYTSSPLVSASSGGIAAIAGENIGGAPVVNGITSNPPQGYFDAYWEVFDTTKAGAASLLSASYLGANGFMNVFASTVDEQGNLLFGGDTNTPTLPVVNAYQSTCNAECLVYGSGAPDGFVSRVPIGASAGSVTLVPATQSFPSTAVGSTSTTQTSTLTNTGSLPVTLSSGSLTDSTDFTQSTNCGSSLSGGSSCTVTFTFNPQSAGPLTSTYSIGDLDNQSVALTVTLDGTGTPSAGPQPVLMPASLGFGSVTVGSTSAAQVATLSNTGGVPQGISSFGFFGPNASSFSETNNCSPTLAAGASCKISITCSPSAEGALSANLGANFPSPEPQESVALTCTGTAAAAPQAALTPAVANFSAASGTTSPPATFTLTNAGNAALAITSVKLGGTGASSFTMGATTCGSSLAATSSCTISVTFTPATGGSYSAMLSVTDAVGVQTSTLVGNATAAQATLTPAIANFGSITSGTTSAAQTFTLANTGNAVLAISSISLEGANASVFVISTNNCGTALAAGSSCAISVTFTPAAIGSATATLSVADNASSSPQTSSLMGTGAAPPTVADFNMTATPATQSVTAGSSATYTVTVASMGGTFAQAVVLAASGLPPGATVTFAPASVTPGSSSAQSTMVVQTVAQRAAGRNGLSPWPFTAPVFAALLLIFPGKRFRLGKKSRGAFTSLACIVALLGISVSAIGCGAGFALPSSAKTYTITVTGTSGSDTHSTTVTLTVQ